VYETRPVSVPFCCCSLACFVKGCQYCRSMASKLSFLHRGRSRNPGQVTCPQCAWATSSFERAVNSREFHDALGRTAHAENRKNGIKRKRNGAGNNGVAAALCPGCNQFAREAPADESPHCICCVSSIVETVLRGRSRRRAESPLAENNTVTSCLLSSFPVTINPSFGSPGCVPTSLAGRGCPSGATLYTVRRRRHARNGSGNTMRDLFGADSLAICCTLRFTFSNGPLSTHQCTLHVPSAHSATAQSLSNGCRIGARLWMGREKLVMVGTAGRVGTAGCA